MRGLVLGLVLVPYAVMCVAFVLSLLLSATGRKRERSWLAGFWLATAPFL